MNKKKKYGERWKEMQKEKEKKQKEKEEQIRVEREKEVREKFGMYWLETYDRWTHYLANRTYEEFERDLYRNPVDYYVD